MDKELFNFCSCFFFAPTRVDLSLVFSFTIIFLAFSLLSSAVYILNDLADYDLDKNHPIKKKRIIASSASKPTHFQLNAFLLIFCGVLAAWYVSASIALVCCAYIINNLIYNFLLKKMVILDLISLLLGYYLRLIAGCLLINVDLSFRLAAMVLLMASVFILTKRRSDVILMNSGVTVRASIIEYSKINLELIIKIILVVCVILFAEYLINVKLFFELKNYGLAIPFVSFVLFCWSYANSFVSEPHKDPIQNIFSNKLVLLLIILAIFAFNYFTR